MARTCRFAGKARSSRRADGPLLDDVQAKLRLMTAADIAAITPDWTALQRHRDHPDDERRRIVIGGLFAGMSMFFAVIRLGGC